MVQDALTLLSRENSDFGVTVIEKLAADLPQLDFDYNQIKQVIINLLINAHDAVSQNGLIKVKTWYKANRA
ncbi:MAG: PAS domain-containing sensor histidine kinase, partial [Gammaproteobacteria bacterium]|nr:PAS domain-containing sensor histidine kinase [Gammaproteobacteria bacterium]